MGAAFSGATIAKMHRHAGRRHFRAFPARRRISRRNEEAKPRTPTLHDCPPPCARQSQLGDRWPRTTNLSSQIQALSKSSFEPVRCRLLSPGGGGYQAAAPCRRIGANGRVIRIRTGSLRNEAMAGLTPPNNSGRIVRWSLACRSRGVSWRGLPSNHRAGRSRRVSASDQTTSSPARSIRRTLLRCGSKILRRCPARSQIHRYQYYLGRFKMDEALLRRSTLLARLL